MYSDIRPWLLVLAVIFFVLALPQVATVLVVILMGVLLFGESKRYDPMAKSGPSDYQLEVEKFRRIKKVYLKTQTWKDKRIEVLQRDGFECVQCGKKGALEVHHITYENLCHEPLDDLVSLCRDCHQDIHDEYGYSPDGFFPIL